MTSWANNRVDLFVLGTDSSVWHKWWDGSAWGPGRETWESLGGQSIYQPVSISWGPNRLDIFIVNFRRELEHKCWNGSVWSGWENLSGTWSERPSVSSWGANRLDVFLVGVNRRLYHKYWNSSQWNTGFEDLGGQFADPVGVVCRAPNKISVYGTTIDHRIHNKWFDGAVWGPNGIDGAWDDLGGTFYGQPKVVSWAAERIDVFAIGNQSALYTRHWNGSQWSNGWENLGGTCREIPEAVVWGAGIMSVFVIGTDHDVWHKWYNNGWNPGQTEYEAMKGLVTKQLTAVSQANNKIDLFIISADGACYIKSYDSSVGGWKPSVTGYASLGGKGFCMSAVGRSH